MAPGKGLQFRFGRDSNSPCLFLQKWGRLKSCLRSHETRGDGQRRELIAFKTSVPAYCAPLREFWGDQDLEFCGTLHGSACG